MVRPQALEKKNYWVLGTLPSTGFINTYIYIYRQKTLRVTAVESGLPFLLLFLKADDGKGVRRQHLFTPWQTRSLPALTCLDLPWPGLTRLDWHQTSGFYLYRGTLRPTHPLTARTFRLAWHVSWRPWMICMYKKASNVILLYHWH